MEHGLTRQLFSRGASPAPASAQPPVQDSQTHPPQSMQQFAHAHVSPPHSLRDVSSSSPPTRVDQIFNPLLQPGAAPPPPHTHVQSQSQSQSQLQPQPQSPPQTHTQAQAPLGTPSSIVFPQASSQASNPGGSGAGTPVSNAGHSVASSSSAPANAAQDSRQNVLLSLLGTVSSPSANPAPVPQQAPVQPQNTTPPSAMPPSNETQSRMLLEQLMSGNHSRSNYQPATIAPPAVSGISAQYPPSPYPPSSYTQTSDQQHETSSYYEPESVPPPSVHAQTSAPVQDPATLGSPSPPKSKFDFVSPFDAFSPPASMSRKPVPPVQSGMPPMESSEPWGSLAMDPKRKSVENLIEQLSRANPVSAAAYEQQSAQQVQQQQQPQQQSQQSQPTLQQQLAQQPVDESEANQAKQSRPLPPKPPMQSTSPRASPPKAQTSQQQQQQQQQQERRARQTAVESSLGPAVTASAMQASREKDESPGPRGGSWKGQRGSGGKNKTAPPSVQPQSIVVDVSLPIDEIQAQREAVKSTAIALVRVDSTFLPGTTIGATHWVAYAMTRGRVRVISRSSGDRTLLQLPPAFPLSASVTDMAVFGNRLAGVTSDGGFVVWELPELITDDVPGRVLLCVLPLPGPDGLRSVKWHPKQENTLAVASESNIYIMNILDAARVFGSETTIDQSMLARMSTPMHMPSALVAFEFDVVHSAIATMSDDSTLAYYSMRDHAPFWSTKVKGEGVPSSITFVDGGVVIGRKHGNLYQLLSHMGRNVLAQIKFVNGDQDDPDMFGHVNYDARIQTLWVANSRRDSMIAFKLGFEDPSTGHGDEIRPFFEQAVEFGGPKPTIHFVILTADADPTGEEAHAACVAAKVPPGELALVAFSVHSTGVDQILIRREWFDGAFASTLSKLPSPPPKFVPQTAAGTIQSPLQAEQSRTGRGMQQQQQQHQPAQVPLAQPVAHPSPVGPPRLRTPTSEEVEPEAAQETTGRPAEARGRNKGKNVGWKEKEEREKSGKGNAGSGSEPAQNGEAIGKELKKMEESLHTRITRHINKELDKQHQRFEDVRVSEQAADFARQEKILKLISTELTKNTTRVVEMAVKAEVQNSVLPSLENITKNEVKLALNGQIAKGLGDTMNKALPNEIERLLLRPDVSAHVARTFSSAITPVIERHVKDAIHQTLIPTYQQQSSSMHQELAREMQSEMLNIKKEVIAWQSEALRGQEALIRDLEQSVRVLSDQVKYLSMNANAAPAARRSATPPGASGPVVPYNQQTAQMRHVPPQQSVYGPLPPPQQLIPPPQATTMSTSSLLNPPQTTTMPTSSWFPSGIPAPQASHPALPPPAPAPVHHSPPAQVEEWDDTYLAVLGTDDPRQLRDLLARSNPDVVLPLKGPTPLSQAVVLTLVHRLASAIGELAPVDESFKSSLWWLQRASTVLNTIDPIISPYVARVIPNVNSMLNTTKGRISIIPNVPQALETARSISEIQDILSRKFM